MDKWAGDRLFFAKNLFKTGDSIEVKVTLLSEPFLDFKGNRVTNLRNIEVVRQRSLGRALWLAAVGVAVGVAAVPVWNIAFPSRSLLVQCSSPQVLLEGPEASLVELQYKGKALDSLYRASCLIANTGRSPILRADLVSPIRIVSGAAILEVAQQAVPPSLGLEMRQIDNGIEVLPEVFNPGDSITVNLLLQSPAPLLVTARIVGIAALQTGHSRESAGEKK